MFFSYLAARTWLFYYYICKYNWLCKVDWENRLGRCLHFKVKFSNIFNKPIRWWTKLKSSNGKPISSRIVVRSWSLFAQVGESIRTDMKTRSSKGLLCNYLDFCDSFLLYQIILVVRLASGKCVIEYAASCLFSKSDIKSHDCSSLVRSHLYLLHRWSISLVCADSSLFRFYFW